MVSVPDPVRTGVTLLTFGSVARLFMSVVENEEVPVELTIIDVGPSAANFEVIALLMPAVMDVSATIEATPIMTMIMVSAVRTFFSLRSVALSQKMSFMSMLN